MPRPKRIHYEDAVYHVTSRGNERRKIVLDDADRWIFLKVLAETVEHHGVVCHVQKRGQATIIYYWLYGSA